MKPFRTMFPILGVVAVLAGCSGAESANTGVASNALTAQGSSASDTAAKPEGRQGGHRHGPGGGPDFLVFAALHDDIGLRADQRATIEGLVEKGRPSEGRRAPDEAKTAEIAAAIRAGNVDASKLKAADGAGFEQRRAKAAERLATLHATLTKEQRAALVDAVVAKRVEGPKRGGPKADRPEGRHEGGPRGHLLGGLDLTQAQKDQIEAKLAADRPARPSEADRAAMKQAMDAKLQSFKADTFDAKAFVAPPANAPKMGSPAAHMAKELNAIVSVLTPAQREQLAQKIEQGPPARK